MGTRAMRSVQKGWHSGPAYDQDAASLSKPHRIDMSKIIISTGQMRKLRLCISFLLLLEQITLSLVAQNSKIYYLAGLEARSPKGTLLSSHRRVSRATSLLGAPGRTISCYFWRIEALGFLGSGPLHHPSQQHGIIGYL